MLPGVIAAGALLVALYILYKLRAVQSLLHEVHDAARNLPATHFRQYEALLGLYVELDLQKSLPATRGWAASPDFLLELATHTMRHRPACVLECSSGASTLVLARCMQRLGQGKVHSLEHDSHYAQQTRQLLAQHGLSAWATVWDAPLKPQRILGEEWLWYSLDALPPDSKIDLLVIDGPPMATGALARYPAGPLLFPLLTPGASVFLDDAARRDEQAILARWQAEFPALRQSSRPCEKGCAVLTGAAFADSASN